MSLKIGGGAKTKTQDTVPPHFNDMLQALKTTSVENGRLKKFEIRRKRKLAECMERIKQLKSGDYKEELGEIEEKYILKVASVKNDCKNHVAALEKKFDNTLSLLRMEWKKQIEELQRKYTNLLTEECTNQVQDLKKKFNETTTRLEQKYETLIAELKEYYELNILARIEELENTVGVHIRNLRNIIDTNKNGINGQISEITQVIKQQYEYQNLVSTELKCKLEKIEKDQMAINFFMFG